MLAVLSVVATVVLERRVGLGLFRRAQYWVAMAIVGFFQVLVDGWLTKLSAPIVIYNAEHHLGLRFPWDVPVEDYLFGFSMLTGAIILWERAKRRRTSIDVTRGDTSSKDQNNSDSDTNDSDTNDKRGSRA